MNNTAGFSKLTASTIAIGLLLYSVCIAQTMGIRESQTSPTGASANGIATSLTCSSPTVHVGQPINVTLELRNVSNNGLHALFAARAGGYRFVIINDSTLQVVSKRDSPRSGWDTVGGPSAGREIKRGYSKFVEFRLDDYYQIDQPGKYRVALLDGEIYLPPNLVKLPSSNTITITVLP